MLHEFAEELAVKLEGKAPATESQEYYDQTTSPLPRKTHCRLVRQGKLDGFKVAGHVYVKRADMHAFIEAHKVDPQLPYSEDNDAVAAAALEKFGMKRTG
jgi:hypothetical protein